ncbi:GFA family protein [Mangrovicella endophytica]|uniref:GFA family protein n=1 Tax=Mangrovicella endophytica TaxID=2066697 RepID=UPI000C9E41F8|nr:GFA family protein [Mangrovicella endophytica]
MSGVIDAEGGCACGAVRLRARGAIVAMPQCWCTECQKETGGGPTNSVVLPDDSVELLSGDVGIFRRRSDAGNEVSHRFCRICANVLTAEVEGAAYTAVRIGAFDDTSFFAPQMILFRTSAPAWAHFPDGCQQFDTQPRAAV